MKKTEADITQLKNHTHKKNQMNQGSDNGKVWVIKKLGEVSEYFNGLTYSPKDVSDKGTIVLRSSNIQNDELDFSDLVRVNVNIKEKLFLKEGDILMCSRNGSQRLVGKTAPILNLQEPMTFGTFMMIIRSEFSPYLLWFFKTDEFKKQISGGENTMINQVTRYMLDEIEIPLPPLPEQQRIVSILDECFAAIAKAKANAEQNLKNAKELFESYLQGVFENGNWETKTIEMVCDEIFAGGDAPKNNFSLEPNEKHRIPIYANAVKDRGLYGYTDFARVTKPCVTISARGSGTGHTELRNELFLPIVRLIVCIPDTNQMSTEFLKYTIDNLVIQRSGSAIPQLTIPMIKEYNIPVPTIVEQSQIIEKAEILRAETEKLEAIYQKKINYLEELKKSILQKAFAGELKTKKALEYVSR